EAAGTGGDGGSSLPVTTGRAGAGARLPAAVRPRSLSSGLFVHRHAKVASWSPLMPSVRTSVHPRHASTIVAAIVARRAPPKRRRAATAEPTNARHRTGMA